MLYAGTSVEEAFRVQSLDFTPPLQNLIVLYKISSNFNNSSDCGTFFLQSQKLTAAINISASLALLLLLMHRKTLWLVFVPNVVSRVSSMSMNLENAVTDFSNWEEAVEFGLFQSMSHSMTEMQALSSLASLEGSPTEQLEAAFGGGTLKELDCDFWSSM
jgi:hypothetical protein